MGATRTVGQEPINRPVPGGTQFRWEQTEVESCCHSQTDPLEETVQGGSGSPEPPNGLPSLRFSSLIFAELHELQRNPGGAALFSHHFSGSTNISRQSGVAELRPIWPPRGSGTFSAPLPLAWQLPLVLPPATRTDGRTDAGGFD